MRNHLPRSRRTLGFSLIELMIAITIGLILLTGLSYIFLGANEQSKELQKTAQQIENGRFSIDTLTQNIHHAGFYGHFSSPVTVPGSLSDPCEISSLTTLQDALAFPIQGYRAADWSSIPDVTGTTCDDKGLLVAANMKAGSDVLVIRRAATQSLPIGAVPQANDVYILSTSGRLTVQVGTTTAITATSQTDGATSCSPYCMQNNKTAPIRKYVTHVYFVAPCSIGSGANGICASSDDAIPTLKRLELVSESGTRKMKIVPLVEGVEYLKVEYGLDSSPATASVTGFPGDGIVDSFTAAPASVADWANVISAKIYVLARNTVSTPGYADTKTYAMGSVTTSAANDAFKRHVYSAHVRLINPMGRREIP